ncbi:MAG: DUF1836 domain-containing protein [Oscillospiraceae bacterium]|nr:DUF1836 domain-containing protein [Oscillospiraceae bacterium]
MAKNSPLLAVCDRLTALKLLRWDELPDLELYMDQVLSLVGRYLGAYPGYDKKGLTASMVNNYVKMGAMPPPEKKRYCRVHLAYLLMICVLKSTLSITAIRDMIAHELEGSTEQAVYDRFCEQFEREAEAAADAHRAVAQEDALPICRAALRAQAEQALAVTLAETLAEAPAKKPEKEKKEK